MKFVTVLLFSFVLLCQSTKAEEDEEKEKTVYNKLLKDYHRWLLSQVRFKFKCTYLFIHSAGMHVQRPESASFSGEHGYDADLDPVSLENAIDAQAQCEGFVQRADEMLEAKPPILSELEVGTLLKFLDCCFCLSTAATANVPAAIIIVAINFFVASAIVVTVAAPANSTSFYPHCFFMEYYFDYRRTTRSCSGASARTSSRA